LTAFHRAPADLVHRVLRDGRIVFDRDPPARIRFEVRRRNEYFDLAPRDVRGRLELMAGFRNAVVHMYEDVNLAIVRDVVENHLGDLLEFVAAIRFRL
jgi:hypothetical protein